jgi:hypothetical protein
MLRTYANSGRPCNAASRIRGHRIVRKLPAAIVLSMASHAAAFAWVVRDGGVAIVPLRGAPAAAAALPPAPPPESEPIAVVFLDDHSAPTPRDAAPDRTPVERRAISTSAARGHEPPRGAPAISTGTARGDELPRGAPASGGPARSPWLTMRGLERPGVVGLSPAFLADFLAHSRPVPPPPDIPGERIGDEIAELRKQLRHGAGAGAGDLPQLVALNDQRAAEELKPAGGGTYRADKETFTAKVDADGTVHLKDKPGKLDTQDRMMLRMGIDPYGRNKLAFLDRTRDQRAAVGERYNRAQLARSTELMQNNIDRLWAVTSELAARKAGLFELWDDCAEAGSDELVAGGAAARALVIGAIRARLRGDDAYTATELAQLNADRRSTAVFAPYE